MNRRASRNIHVSPFTFTQRFTTAHYIKYAFGALFLFPFRFFLFTTFLLMVLFVGTITTATMSAADRKKPMTGIRRHVLRPLFCALSRLTFMMIGFNYVHFKGTPARREEAPIMVLAPHSTFFDGVPLLPLGLPSVMGRSVSAKGPLGSLLRMTMPILVDRDDPDSRKNSIREIAARTNLAEDWPTLVIFPEGTCSNRSVLFEFKIGAFTPGVPVQPVLIRWPNETDTTTWSWDGPSGSKLLFLTMCTFNTNLLLEFLPVYHPSPAEVADAQLYANNVRDVMATALNVPAVNFSYEACKLVTSATQLDLPMSPIIVDLRNLSKSLGQCIGESSEGLGAAVPELMPVYEQLVSTARTRPNCGSLQQVPALRATLEHSAHLCESLTEFYLAGKNRTESIDLRRLVIHLVLTHCVCDTRDRFLLAMETFENLHPEGGLHRGACPNEKFYENYIIAKADAEAFISYVCPPSLYNKVLVLETIQRAVQEGKGQILLTNLFHQMCAVYPKVVEAYAKFNSQQPTRRAAQSKKDA